MPRHARLIINDCPHHIIQRGHNRQVVFARDDDYRYYLETLQEWKSKLGCKVYSYCLMTNHVHLVIDPGSQVENLSLLMKRIAGRQTRYINTMENRSGSLWEGRFKSSPISANEYLLACCRYVELNPVRAGMVEEPWQYPWSSCQEKTGEKELSWLDADPFYLSLGKTPEEQAKKYQQWLSETIQDGELVLIREATQRGQLTGSRKFEQEISKKIGRRIELRGQGRPKKEK
ncbi:MAG: transposase [Proteobacteria bacterium]|jgi:putative transposase|nr:transposase [Desulfocapsa sp.]MBU3943678.1 transposase [Pseudomonadota bacterium]MCG2742995.1 transposase [Desulfobacteraceae bacterium]MBU4030466.1 transposase [Pseudomonadota bacterium]MBU4043858.1 transposase [Pseudomonadota bacterium]